MSLCHCAKVEGHLEKMEEKLVLADEKECPKSQ